MMITRIFFLATILFSAISSCNAIADSDTTSNVVESFDVHFDSTNIGDFLMPYQLQPRRTTTLFDNYITAVPYLDFATGLTDNGDVSPWISSLCGLTAQHYFIQTGDNKYKDLAYDIRTYLRDHIKQDSIYTSVWYVPYSKSNSYAVGQGTRYHSSLASTAFVHFLLRFPDVDYDEVRKLMLKFQIESKHFGSYAKMRGYVNWEETASLYRPSYIMNGGQVGSHQIAQIVKLLPPADFVEEILKLNELNKSYILLNLNYLYPTLFLYVANADQSRRWIIRYDHQDLEYDTTFLNSREPTHYAGIIAKDYMNWLKAEGYYFDPEIEDMLNGIFP